MSGLEEARRMLDLFASVGADRYYVTKSNILEAITRAWPTTPDRLAEVLPAVLRAAAVRKPCRIAEGSVILAGENVIVRPQSRSTAFIQLDDVHPETLERIRPAAFLVLATSPGNCQAWLAVRGMKGQVPPDEVKDFARRVKKGRSDKSASGAVRLAGTQNFKVKYHPDFPTVAIMSASPGRMVDRAEMDRLGIVSPPEPPRPPLPPFRASGSGLPARRPSYQMSLARAPAARNHQGPDRSMADFVFCMTAIDWGFSIEAAAQMLFEESGKAREKGRDYALQTARNAFQEVEKNRTGQGHATASHIL
jgi:hypothetical protein